MRELASAGELTRFWLTLVLAFAVMALELRRRAIPNWVTLGLLPPVLFVAFAFDRTGDALLGGVVAFVPGILVWQKGALGGGVVKAGLLVGAAGGLVVGGSLAALFLGILALVSLADGASHPRLRALTEAPVRITPAMFVVALVGLVVRHLLAPT